MPVSIKDLWRVRQNDNRREKQTQRPKIIILWQWGVDRHLVLASRVKTVRLWLP